jgi:pyruvate/2-oxoglutarate dehydrogenase complex dihydrolipoamide acyltransferase (E2) component
VLSLRYDPARIDDAAALAVLRALARLVADPTALAVAY